MEKELDFKTLIEERSSLLLLDPFLKEVLSKTSFLDFLLHLTTNPTLYDNLRDKQQFWQDYAEEQYSSSSFQLSENWFDYVADQALGEKNKFLVSKFTEKGILSLKDLQPPLVGFNNSILKSEDIREIFHLKDRTGLPLEVRWMKNGQLITHRRDDLEPMVEDIPPVIDVRKINDTTMITLFADNGISQCSGGDNRLRFVPIVPPFPEDIPLKEVLYILLVVMKGGVTSFFKLIFVLDSKGELYTGYLNERNTVEYRKQLKINSQLKGISHMEALRGEWKGVKLFTSSGELYFLNLNLIETDSTLSVRSSPMEILEEVDNLTLAKVHFKQIDVIPHSNFVLLLDNDGNLFYREKFPTLEEFYQQKQSLPPPPQKQPLLLREGLTLKNFVVKDLDYIQWEFESPRYVPYFYYLLSLQKKEVKEDWMDLQFFYYRKKNSSRVYIAPIPSSS